MSAYGLLTDCVTAVISGDVEIRICYSEITILIWSYTAGKYGLLYDTVLLCPKLWTHTIRLWANSNR